MNKAANGHSHDQNGPLHMTPKQRHDLLASHNMSAGWLLLTRAEMNGMRDAMNQACAEVERLEGELAKAVASSLTQQLNDANRVGLLQGALEGLRFQVDEATRRRIEDLLERAKQTTP